MKFSNEHIRRQDRTMEESRMLEILEQGEYGVLSMVDQEKSGAYGIPLSYVWDGKSSIYIHCAPLGRKLKCIDACAKVSFCVVGKTHVVPERFTTEYESIVLSCTAQYGLLEAERKIAMRLFVAKYCPEHKEIGETYIVKSFHRTEVIRLDILEVSGKTKRL